MSLYPAAAAPNASVYNVCVPTQHSAEFLRALLDASPFGVIALDKEALVRLWNRGAERILGWNESEIIGLPLPPQIDSMSSGLEVVEAHLRRRDGTAVDTKSWSSPWQEGTLIILEDTSLYQRAEREIHELIRREQDALGQVQAERRFRELLEAAPDAIIEVDREGHILTLNAVTEKLFGYARAELLGQAVEVLVPSRVRKHHAGYRADYDRHPATRPMGSGLALEAARKDGSTFPVEISLSPVRSAGNHRTIAVIRDVTERKETERRMHAIQLQHMTELESRNQEIERANRHKTEFLANMSHELRTPLHTVIGFSELLAEEGKGPLNADQKRFIGHIYKDAQHLLALINEVLDLSKIEEGKLQLRREAVDITVAIEEVLASIRPRCVDKGIELEIETSGPLAINGDQLRVRQVLYNLLSNAVKFTPPGGQIHVRAARAGEFAEIAVTDTGVGIPLEEQELVFEAFHQVGSAGAGLGEGTGLGLPITRRLIEAHGGRIWLTGGPGSGSTFTFTIPLSGAR